MKKIILSVAVILLSVHCMAQEQLAFPFKDGKDAMKQFFKDSLEVSPEIIQKKAIGIAFVKFTADEKGSISKIIVYYADDALLVSPVIDALRKSNHQWILPKHEKAHDFIIPFAFNFIPPTSSNPKLQKTSTLKLQKKLYGNYLAHNPIMADDQVPLNETTLLPVVVVSYDLTQ